MTFEQMRAVTLGLQPLSRLDSPREVVRQFTPNWFAATMGTGILAIALSQFQADVPMLHALAEGLWMFNIALFTLFAGLYAARWIFFFDGAKRIFGHSVVSMFFGCIPMGLATIVNGFLIFGLPRYGEVAVGIAETLWWIDVAMAAACGVAIPFMMFTRQSHTIDQMTAVWLLPVVAAEVAAVSGGLLAPHLVDPHSQFVVLTLSYALWALSVPIALSILVVLLLRMAIHKLPHANMAASSWLALGPIGTGALGLMTLAARRPRSCPPTVWSASAPSRKDSASSAACSSGLWPLVAGDGRSGDAALPARRPSLQHRLVGLHVPARRLCRRHAEARHAPADRRHPRLRRGARRGAGGALGDRRHADGARRLAGDLFVSPCLKAG